VGRTLLEELILGLDPGSRHTGYGLIAVRGEHMVHVACGVIDLPEKHSLHERLRILHQELSALFARFPVRVVAIEKIFLGKNADSAFKLGHARGVCLLAAAQNSARIEEYAARFVKKCITGFGAADKQQVQMMIFNWLRIQPVELAFDATDALSLAVTYARMSDVSRRMSRGGCGLRAALLGPDAAGSGRQKFCRGLGAYACA
jgi:crossover junction endodeoxyribonuclease RuvC